MEHTGAACLLKNGDRILFEGDSLTRRSLLEEGEAHLRHVGYTASWVDVVERMLLASYPEARIAFFNRAVGGSRIADVLSRLEANLAAVTPTWVSLMIGVNDAYDREVSTQLAFPVGLEDVIRTCRFHHVEHLVFMTPTVHNEDADSSENARLGQYAQAVQEVANRHNVRIVDAHERILSHLRSVRRAYRQPYAITVDGVHMNAIGNQIIAQEWLKTLQFCL